MICWTDSTQDLNYIFHGLVTRTHTHTQFHFFTLGHRQWMQRKKSNERKGRDEAWNNGTEIFSLINTCTYAICIVVFEMDWPKTNLWSVSFFCAWYLSVIGWNRIPRVRYSAQYTCVLCVYVSPISFFQKWNLLRIMQQTQKWINEKQRNPPILSHMHKIQKSRCWLLK